MEEGNYAEANKAKQKSEELKKKYLLNMKYQKLCGAFFIQNLLFLKSY